MSSARRPDPGVRPAQRQGAPGWRDPRLWVGVVVVAVSVVLGARAVGAADDTVAVWAVAGDLAPGERIGADDLTPARVRFADEEDLARYVRTGETLPADATATRGLGRGELLPRASLGSAGDAGTVQVAVAVDDVRVPSAVGPGTLVDVYLLGGGRGRGEDLLLDDVTVVGSSSETGFGDAGRRKLELAVPAEVAPAFFERVAGDQEAVLSVAAVAPGGSGDPGGTQP